MSTLQAQPKEANIVKAVSSGVEVSKETKTQEVPAQESKEVKEVLMRREPNGKWVLVTKCVKQRDINQIRRILPVLWNRSMREKRKARRVETTKTTVKPVENKTDKVQVKEMTNG